MLFLRPIGGDIGRNELLDLGGGGGAIGGTGGTVGLQHVGLQVQREADVVLPQVLDLGFVFSGHGVHPTISYRTG